MVHNFGWTCGDVFVDIDKFTPTSFFADNAFSTIANRERKGTVTLRLVTQNRERSALPDALNRQSCILSIERVTFTLSQRGIVTIMKF